MIGLCPECHESIRVPVGGEELEVRCPLCNATYSLGKVLQSLPPSLEIVGSPGVDLRLDDSSQGIGPRVSIERSCCPIANTPSSIQNQAESTTLWHTEGQPKRHT